jgi:tRNA A64-2'-O-ribosylphosphate transferase
VPIWCAVVNRAARLRGLAEAPSLSLSSSSSSSDIAAAEDLDLDFDLRTPPGAVSPHEHAQIAARLDGWATALAVSCVPAVLTLLYSCSRRARAHTHTGLVVCTA